MNQVDMIRCRLIDSHSINHNTMIRSLCRGLEQSLDLFGRRARSHEAPGGGLLTHADQFKRPIGGVEVIHVFRGVGID